MKYIFKITPNFFIFRPNPAVGAYSGPSWPQECPRSLQDKFLITAMLLVAILAQVV